MDIGLSRYTNRASYDLVPGYQLIDREFVLRKDSAGHHPPDTYEDVVDEAKRLLQQ